MDWNFCDPRSITPKRVDDEFSTQLFHTKGAIWLTMHFFHSGISAGFPAAGAKKEKFSLPFPFAIQQQRVKMDLREVKIKQELDQGNHFARIPEDLLIFILSKMKDLKYLCQCCLVSKRFNSSVYLIKTVSVALPSNEMSSAQSASELKFLFYKIFSLTSEEVNRFLRSSSFNWLKFLLYLQKFEQLELISLKFTCPANLCSSSFFNLKVRFSDSGTLIERLISIMPARVYKVNEHGYHFEPRDMRTYCKTQVNICCCAKWLFVLGLLLKCKPSLKSIVITNSNKPWTVVLNEKSLVAWRKSMFLSGCMLDNTTTLEKRAGVMSELRLPISGYVMNKV